MEDLSSGRRKSRAFYHPEYDLIIVKSVALDPGRLSLLEKIFAIVGLNGEVAYCRKHRLYYKEALRTDNVVYECPECYKDEPYEG